MDNGLVSVIIPMYNAEKYIIDCLNSVFNQSYKNYEVIVVDDCSTDNSFQLVKDMQDGRDNLILLKNEKNLNVAETRNVGIKKAKGKWIAFLDADDVWMPEKMEKQMLALKENDSKLSYTSIEFIDDDGNETGKSFKIKPTVNYKSLLKQNIICLSSSVVEKELCLKYPFKNPEVHEDFIFWLEILKNEKTNPIGLTECLTKYRLTNASKSRNKLKSAKMTYKTYKKAGLNFFKAHYNLLFYIIRSLKKYH